MSPAMSAFLMATPVAELVALRQDMIQFERSAFDVPKTDADDACRVGVMSLDSFQKRLCLLEDFRILAGVRLAQILLHHCAAGLGVGRCFKVFHTGCRLAVLVTDEVFQCAIGILDRLLGGRFQTGGCASDQGSDDDSDRFHG